MAIRSTGIRPIERNGLRGFGLTIVIDNETPAEPLGQVSAPGADNPPPAASGATLHDAWRSHGFNPDRVDR